MQDETALIKELEEQSTNNVEVETPTVEFSWQDAENLWASAAEIQRNASRKVDGQEINSLPLDMDMELSELISQLRKWVTPFIDSRDKIALGYGFLREGSQYKGKPSLKNTERESNYEKLTTEFDEANKGLFKHLDKLKAMLPLKTFSKAQIEKSAVYFNKCEQRQYFIEYCIPK